MSADLSDPAIASAISEINDPASSTSLLALKYHSTQDKTLVLLSTGSDPWVNKWQEVIEAHKGEPLFGYGIVAKGRPMREGGEKGVVLVYLPEEVTGVRRALATIIPAGLYADSLARAVVHSRALANKFPEYSAIITISHSSQITEDFVRDQVNFYNQPVATPTSSPVKPRTAAQMGLGLGNGRPPASTDRDSGHPSPVEKMIQPSASSTRSGDRPLPAPPAAPLDLPDNPSLHANTPPRTTTPPPPSGPRHSTESTSNHDHPGGRKDSLSSRFAKVLPGFSKHNDRRESGGDSPKSPSRFESLTSGFGKGGNTRHERVSTSGSQVVGGGVGENHSAVGERDYLANVAYQAPLPLPPKSNDVAPSTSDRAVHFSAPRDSASATSTTQEPSASSSHHSTPMPLIIENLTPKSEAPQVLEHSGQADSRDTKALPPPPAPKVSHPLPRPLPSNQNPQPPAFNRLHTLGPVVNNPAESGYSPTGQPLIRQNASQSTPLPMSPTASAALSQARAKQVDAETRVHDQFRRTEEERTRIRVNSGNRNAGIVRTPTPMQGQGDYDSEEEGLPYDRPEVVDGMTHRREVDENRMENIQPPAPSFHREPLETRPSTGSMDSRGNALEVGRADTSMAMENVDVGRDMIRGYEEPRSNSDAIIQGGDEDRRYADEPSQRERELESSRLQESQDRDHREREAEHTRLLAEEAAARDMRNREAEDLRRRQEEEEEARLRQKRAQEEEERELRVAHEQERMRARQEEEEQERLRAKLQADAEAQAEAKEAEREKARKRESVRAGLLQGRASGGVMLEGHVTVQTTKSVTWRRRHFKLLPTELRLFKTDTDTTPIQVISLAPGTKVSQTYEESSVQGSFKILSSGVDGSGEDFFLFSDSADEKEILLEALNVALEK